MLFRSGHVCYQRSVDAVCLVVLLVRYQLPLHEPLYSALLVVFPPLVLYPRLPFLPPLRFCGGVDDASAGAPLAFPAAAFFTGAALTISPFFGSRLPAVRAGGCLVVPLVARRAMYSVVSIGADDGGPLVLGRLA